MHDAIERVLISEEQIKARIAQLAQELEAEYANKNPLFVGLLKGVVVFFADMFRAVQIPCELDFMVVSSYSGTNTTGVINVRKDLDTDIKGRHVVILEDIIDSGLTLSHTLEFLRSREPASIKICTLLDKPARRKAPLSADYIGFTIPDEFVVGYGMDFNEQFRNLPYVGILKPEAYS